MNAETAISITNRVNKPAVSWAENQIKNIKDEANRGKDYFYENTFEFNREGANILILNGYKIFVAGVAYNGYRSWVIYWGENSKPDVVEGKEFFQYKNEYEGEYDYGIIKGHINYLKKHNLEEKERYTEGKEIPDNVLDKLEKEGFTIEKREAHYDIKISWK